jgi:hypothetical protein
MIELHRQRIFKKVAPERNVEEKAARIAAPARRRSAARYYGHGRRAGRQQSAKIDLDKNENKNPDGATSHEAALADVRRAREMPWRRSLTLPPPRCPNDGNINQASKQKMCGQTILRDFERSAKPEATIHHPTAPCSAPSPKIVHSGPAVRAVSSHAIGRNGSRNTNPIVRPMSRCVHSHQ